MDEQMETKSTPSEQKTEGTYTDRSIRSVIIGSSIVIWILALFIIFMLNNLGDRLGAIQRSLDSTMQIVNREDLDRYQLVNPDGDVVYQFKLKPDMDAVDIVEGSLEEAQ